MIVPIFVPYKTSEDYYYESLTVEEKKKYLRNKAEFKEEAWNNMWRGTKYFKYLDKAITEDLHGNDELAKKYRKLSDFWFWISTILRIIFSFLVLGLPLIGVFALSFYLLEYIEFSKVFWITIFTTVAYAIYETMFGLKLIDWIWSGKRVDIKRGHDKARMA